MCTPQGCSSYDQFPPTQLLEAENFLPNFLLPESVLSSDRSEQTFSVVIFYMVVKPKAFILNTVFILHQHKNSTDFGENK